MFDPIDAARAGAPTANVSRLLDWARFRYGEKEALVFEGRRWNYREMDENVNALATGLLELGIERDERIAVLAMSVPEYVFLNFALAKIGAVLVPLNYRLNEEELHHLLTHSKCHGLVVDDPHRGTAEALVRRIGALRKNLLLESSADTGWGSVPDLITEHRGARVDDAEVGYDDLQRILYTSGTTSLPKGALLTHGNVFANMNTQVVELALSDRDRILNMAPLYHVGGLDLPGYATWFIGATFVLMRRFDARSLLEEIAREQTTGMGFVATMINLIRELPDREQFDTSSVRFMVFSQVNRKLFNDTLEIFPNAQLIEGYGLTETTNGLTYLDTAHMLEKQGSCGRALHGVDVRVVDEDDRFLPPGGEGEVVARGAKVCKGYLDNPEATAETFRNGWFHTGDVGRFDEDGYLYIVDRLKDMIRSGGENIASAEIERAIFEFDAVGEAAVVGVPHAKWIETPAAFVTPRRGEEIDPEALIAHCRDQLAGFKVPKVIYVVDSLPRNPSGKVLKRELRELVGTAEAAYMADDMVEV